MKAIRFVRCTLSAIALVAATLTAFADDAYIESDGTSGILTDYKLKPSTRIAVDFALTTTEQAAGARLFGADRSHTALKMSGSFYVGGSENTLWVIHLGNGNAYDSVWPKNGNGDFISLDTERHTVVLDYPEPPHLFITGSVTNAVPNDDFTPESFTNESTEPIALFARQNASGAFEKPCKARIYGVKIYENGNLVHDFVPCLSDGMPGFKDVAGEGGFICNASAETSFTYGGDILAEESPYVATPTGNSDADKHLYIDTEYYPSGNMRLELDYALQEAQSSGTWYLFSGTSRFCSYLSSAGIGYGVLSTWGSKSIAKSVANKPGVRRTTVLDIPNKAAMVMTAGYTNETLAITNTSTYAQTATIKLATIAAADDYYASMKIYGCRIYEAGTLVRDFRPCVYGPLNNSSAIVGLRDELTGAFITYPAATSSKRLSCGGNIEQESSPYVETLRSDSRYIDTEYLVQPTTKVALDYAVAAERGADDTWYLFSAQGGSTFTALINKNGFGYNNGSWKLSAGMAAEASLVNIRRTVILDNPASLGVVMTEGVTNLTTTVDDPAGKTYNTKSLKIATPHDLTTHFASIRIYGCKIWEKENGEYVLKRDYVPAIENDVAGLRDATGNDNTFRVCATTAASQLTYGGAFAPSVTQTSGRVFVNGPVTLTAAASGAASYRWFKNGEEIPGKTASALFVTWRHGGETDTYAAKAVYVVDETSIVSALSESVSVKNVPPGLCIILR